MSERELKERDRLARLWVTGRATKSQQIRCMELDRKASRAKGAKR